MSFTKIDIAEQSFNPFDKIGKQWLLISAGTEEKVEYHDCQLGRCGHLGQTVCDLLHPPQPLHQGIC